MICSTQSLPEVMKHSCGDYLACDDRSRLNTSKMITDYGVETAVTLDVKVNVNICQLVMTVDILQCCEAWIFAINSHTPNQRLPYFMALDLVHGLLTFCTILVS